MFSYVDRTALSLLMEPIKVEFKLSDQELGLLSGIAFTLFNAILGLPLARIADHYSRSILLSVSLGLWSVLAALGGMAQSFGQLFMSRVGVGIGEAGCIPAAHSLIADYFPPRHRALAVSIFLVGMQVGLSGGMLAVGFLGQHLSWRAALQIVGFAGLPVSALAYFTLKEPPRPRIVHTAKEPLKGVLAALLRRRAFAHLTFGFGLGSVCISSLIQWLPTYLIRSFGMSITEVGAWAGAASGVGGIAGLLTGGVAATWLAPRDARWELWLPLGTYAACIPFFVLMAFSPAAWFVLVMYSLISFMISLGAGVSLAAAQSFAQPNQRAVAVALMLFLSSLLGSSIGPYVIGVTSDFLAPHFGRESLRYSMLFPCIMLSWSVVHYYLASLNTLRDRLP